MSIAIKSLHDFYLILSFVTFPLYRDEFVNRPREMDIGSNSGLFSRVTETQTNIARINRPPRLVFLLNTFATDDSMPRQIARPVTSDAEPSSLVIEAPIMQRRPLERLNKQMELIRRHRNCLNLRV